MTDFVARDVSHLGVDRIWTSPSAFALYQNLFAFAEKAPGAPVLANSYVVEAMMAANSVPTAALIDLSVTGPKLAALAVSETKVAAAAISQSKLKTAFGDVSTDTAHANLTLPGGAYGFYPQVWNPSGGISVTAYLAEGFQSASPSTNIRLEPSGTGTVSARQRYIQASPPYDLGDGEVPIFVFALVDAGGGVLATYAAEEPPWANNGPTSIRPDAHLPDGTPVKLERARPSLKALRDPRTRDAELAKLSGAMRVVKVTQAMKQADMPLIPHPFLGNDLTGKTVVLLDPVGEMALRLRELQRAGEHLGEVLHGGYLSLGNQALARKGPPGVMAVAVSWK